MYGEFEDFLEELYRRFERLVKKMEKTVRSFEEEYMEDVDAEALRPLTDFYRSGDELVVTADLPMVDPSSIKVELPDNKTLIIEAKITREISSDVIDNCLPPSNFRYFRTVITLPISVTRISSVKLYGDVLEVRLKLR